MKKLPLLFLIFTLLLPVLLFAQDHPAAKGAYILTGQASFAYDSDNNDNTETRFSIGPNVNYFVMDNLFIGGTTSLGYQDARGIKSIGIGLGPELGYMFGDESNTYFPYLSAEYNYVFTENRYNGNISNVKYSRYSFSVGVLFPVKQHIGIDIRAGYTIRDYIESPSQENSIGLTVGVSGLFYNSGE